jgi:dihydrofolate reductase
MSLPSEGVVLVAAVADNGIIGADGGIPWHLPADFAHFKRITRGHPLIMGRTTFEGIGEPLPDRQTIVVTRDPDWSYDGVLTATSVEAAIDLARTLDELVMIGGGAGVYRDALPFADVQVLSRVHVRPKGDTSYPEFDDAQWTLVDREDHHDDDPPWHIEYLHRIRCDPRSR